MDILAAEEQRSTLVDLGPACGAPELGGLDEGTTYVSSMSVEHRCDAVDRVQLLPAAPYLFESRGEHRDGELCSCQQDELRGVRRAGEPSSHLEASGTVILVSPEGPCRQWFGGAFVPLCTPLFVARHVA